MLKDLILRLEGSEEFDKSYGYLVHFFTMLDENLINALPWELGYYSKEKDLIKIYRMGDSIEVAEDKVNKTGKEAVLKLEIDQVKVEFDEIRKIIFEKLAKEYSPHPVMKAFVLLQKREDIMWNITIVTKTFSIINLLIYADSGKIKSDKIETLLSWNANPSLLNKNPD